jgi:iron(III) transport system permease protein
VTALAGTADHVGRPRVAGVQTSTLLMSALTLLVAVLTVTPVAIALVASFRTAPVGQHGIWTLSGIVRVVHDPTTARVIWTTVWLAVVRAGLATALAVVLAWILARTDCPFRGSLEIVLLLSLFFPLVGRVLAWAVLASPRTGYINQLLRMLPFVGGTKGPLNIFSYEGVIFVSVLGFSGLLTVLMLPAFRGIDAALEESARMCGASARTTLLRIVVPLLRPAIVAAFVLSMVRVLSGFETEVFLGTPAGVFVFTNKIYQAMEGLFPPDYPTAFTMVLLLLGVTFVLVVLNWIVVGRRNYTTISGRSYSARPFRLGRLRWLAFVFVATYFLLSLVLPAIVIVQTSFINLVGFDVLNPASYSLKNWNAILTLQLPRQSIGNSLLVGIVATTLGVSLYSLVSYVIVKTDFRARRALDLAAWVPWGVPALVLGLGLLWTVLVSPLGFLYGTLPLLIIAFIIAGFPIGTRIMSASMMQTGRELEESARVHGANWPATFWRIVIPLVRNGAVTAWVLGFTFAFSDLSLVVFLYGPRSSVLPSLFLSLWNGGSLERASVAAVIMTAINLAVVLIMRRLARIGISSAIG